MEIQLRWTSQFVVSVHVSPAARFYMKALAGTQKLYKHASGCETLG